MCPFPIVCSGLTGRGGWGSRGLSGGLGIWILSVAKLPQRALDLVETNCFTSTYERLDLAGPRASNLAKRALQKVNPPPPF